MSSGSGSSSRKSPPRSSSSSPTPSTSRPSAAVMGGRAESHRHRHDRTRSRSPHLANPSDGDASRYDSVAAQDAAALDDTPPAGSSGVATPRAGGSGVATPRAGGSSVATPRAGGSGVATPRAGCSGVGTPLAGSSGVATPRIAGSGDGTPEGAKSNLKFSHILIKHKYSRRPIDNEDKPVTRTKDQAMELVIDIHERISRDLITFADAAVAFSDCTSARHEGDIHSRFKRGRMQKSFQTAALALGPGKISDIIETNSGYHIIQRAQPGPTGDSHRYRCHRPRSRSPRDSCPRSRSPRDSRPRSRSPRDSCPRSRSPRDSRPRSRSPRHSRPRDAAARDGAGRDAMADMTKRDAAPYDGVVGDGESGDAASGDGTFGGRASGEAASGEAASGDGAFGDGASGDAASGDGAFGDGASGDAASGDRALGDGVPSHRDGVNEPANDATPQDERSNVKFRHILIKHKDCRKPLDIENKPVTRTKEEAMDLIIDIHENIRNERITFDDAAASFSDCTYAQNDGDVQSQFNCEKVQRSFERAAMGLSPGHISHIIESKSGYHILQRH